MPVYKLLKDATTVINGTPISLEAVQESLAVQVIISGTGTLTATLVTKGSANGIDFFTLATTKISGTDSATEGFTIKDPWQYIRSDITALTGTSATINVLMVA
jgi:hypothetical protein